MGRGVGGDGREVGGGWHEGEDLRDLRLQVTDLSVLLEHQT